MTELDMGQSMSVKLPERDTVELGSVHILLMNGPSNHID